MERAARIELAALAWKAKVLPLYDARFILSDYLCFLIYPSFTTSAATSINRNMVEGGGFEPPKAEPSDLQSDPFGHSGTPPFTANTFDKVPYQSKTLDKY